jgi:hypothetical protein
VSKHPCKHKYKDSAACNVPALEYEGLEVRVVGRHHGVPHPNRIKLEWIIEQAFLQGDGEVVKKMLTSVEASVLESRSG